MNAVATPTLKTTAKTAKKTGAATKTSTSLSLLEAIQSDLKEARATITHIANSIGPTEADIGLLLDMAAGGVGRSVEYLQSAPLMGAACEDARGETAQTCALLRGAASLAKGMEVDIHSASIISVCEIVDESDNNLDRLSIDLSLSASMEPRTPNAVRPALLTAPEREVSQQVADSLPSGFNKHLVSNAWAHACEAREVVYACVMSYEGPEAIWGIHTIVKLACEKLNEMVNDSMTEEGCEDASNLLAQAIALASMLTETVDGKSWEMLLDAALSLMELAKDRLDSGRGETGNA